MASGDNVVLLWSRASTRRGDAPSTGDTRIVRPHQRSAAEKS